MDFWRNNISSCKLHVQYRIISFQDLYVMRVSIDIFERILFSARDFLWTGGTHDKGGTKSFGGANVKKKSFSRELTRASRPFGHGFTPNSRRIA